MRGAKLYKESVTIPMEQSEAVYRIQWKTKIKLKKTTRKNKQWTTVKAD
jgi:hypothetical protein